MVAITFRNASRTVQLQRHCGAALSACREWLDAFVSNRMRHAVAEAENVRAVGTFIELVHDDKQDL